MPVYFLPSLLKLNKFVVHGVCVIIDQTGHTGRWGTSLRSFYHQEEPQDVSTWLSACFTSLLTLTLAFDLHSQLPTNISLLPTAFLSRVSLSLCTNWGGLGELDTHSRRKRYPPRIASKHNYTPPWHQLSQYRYQLIGRNMGLPFDDLWTVFVHKGFRHVPPCLTVILSSVAHLKLDPVFQMKWSGMSCVLLYRVWTSRLLQTRR